MNEHIAFSLKWKSKGEKKGHDSEYFHLPLLQPLKWMPTHAPRRPSRSARLQAPSIFYKTKALFFLSFLYLLQGGAKRDTAASTTDTISRYHYLSVIFNNLWTL